MTIKTIGLACAFALTSTLVFAQGMAPGAAGGRDMRQPSERSIGTTGSAGFDRSGAPLSSDPNGTPSGPTTLSGTGTSRFGGNAPGAPR